MLAELGHRFANPFQTALDRIRHKSVFIEGRGIHALGETGNGLNVLDDIEQTAGGIVRRQGRGPC